MYHLLFISSILDGDIPRATSQLMRFANHVADFNTGNKISKVKPIKQG